MITFNDLRPALPFVVRVDGTMVQIKPFAGYYIWLDWFDLAPLDFTPAVDILTGLIMDVNAIAVDALAAAAAAAADASTAQGSADSAAAAAAAAAADTKRDRRVTMWHDESISAFGTPAFVIDALQKFGYERYSLTQANVFTHSFVLDLTGAAVIHFLGLTNNGSGQMDVTIDSTYLGQIEWYTAGTVRNVEKTLAIPASTYTGLYHKLTMQGVTKHASSAGYAIALTKMWVTLNTGD